LVEYGFVLPNNPNQVLPIGFSSDHLGPGSNDPNNNNYQGDLQRKAFLKQNCLDVGYAVVMTIAVVLRCLSRDFYATPGDISWNFLSNLRVLLAHDSELAALGNVLEDEPGMCLLVP
jgi:hypothetical protein